MVSDKIIKELNRMYGEYNYRCRLQDISDEKFTAVYKQLKPTSWFDLEDYFYNSTSDKEVHAHLKGFDSYAERQEMLRKYRPNSKLIKSEEQMNLFQLGEDND